MIFFFLFYNRTFSLLCLFIISVYTRNAKYKCQGQWVLSLCPWCFWLWTLSNSLRRSLIFHPQSSFQAFWGPCPIIIPTASLQHMGKILTEIKINWNEFLEYFIVCSLMSEGLSLCISCCDFLRRPQLCSLGAFSPKSLIVLIRIILFILVGWFYRYERVDKMVMEDRKKEAKLQFYHWPCVRYDVSDDSLGSDWVMPEATGDNIYYFTLLSQDMELLLR